MLNMMEYYLKEANIWTVIYRLLYKRVSTTTSQVVAINHLKYFDLDILN